jgi:NAD(P)-dependent dehydrogenase (short-subunit alcohol dehydrogenase family)
MNVDLQLNSYCLLGEHAAQAMAQRRGGSIINIASIYGMVGPDFHVYEGTEMTMPAAYSAVKGGVIAHTRFLASRYGASGVRVNAICPGGVAAGQPASFVNAYEMRTPLGRMAQAEEIGPPTVFLASNASSYITGAVLPVDGGWTAI